MKKFLFLLLLTPILGAAQFDTTKFYRSPNYGDLFRRAKINQLMIPSDTTTNKVGIAQIGSKFFVYNSNKWNEIGSVNIDGKLNISDTAAMLVPYKHWLAGYTPPTRTITTTAPLQGGGDLSANRTLSIDSANAARDGYLSRHDWTSFNNRFANGGNFTSGRAVLGTTNNNPLDFITNNILRGSISSGGGFAWGIGTATPNGDFHIGQQTGDLQVRIGSNTSGTRMNFGQDGLKNFFELTLGNDWLIGGWPTNDFRISRLGNNYFNINSVTGNVGVRTIVDNGFNFNVNGHARILNGLSFSSQGTDIATSQSITASSSGDFNFNNPASSGWFFNWNQNGATRMRLSTNNNLLINTTTDAGFRLDVNGTARVTGSVRVTGSTTINSGSLKLDNNLSIDNLDNSNNYRRGFLLTSSNDYQIGAVDAGWGNGVYIKSGGFMRFTVNGISGTFLSAMDINTLGNVGLGIQDPMAKLDVVGTVRISEKITQPTTANSPVGDATLVNGTVTISNTQATTGCKIDVKYRTGTALTSTSSILVVTNVTNSTGFTVTAYNAGAATTNTLDNNQIEYTISN